MPESPAFALRLPPNVIRSFVIRHLGIPAMSRRSRAREIALQALFQEDLNPENALGNLGAFKKKRCASSPSNSSSA